MTRFAADFLSKIGQIFRVPASALRKFLAFETRFAPIFYQKIGKKTQKATRFQRVFLWRRIRLSAAKSGKVLNDFCVYENARPRVARLFFTAVSAVYRRRNAAVLSEKICRKGKIFSDFFWGFGVSPTSILGFGYPNPLLASRFFGRQIVCQKIFTYALRAF